MKRVEKLLIGGCIMGLMLGSAAQAQSIDPTQQPRLDAPAVSQEFSPQPALTGSSSPYLYMFDRLPPGAQQQIPALPATDGSISTPADPETAPSGYYDPPESDGNTLHNQGLLPDESQFGRNDNRRTIVKPGNLDYPRRLR